MSESEFKRLPNGDRRQVQVYKDNEQARWKAVQQRIRNQMGRKDAIMVPHGVEPTKLVLRYLDSTAPLEETVNTKNPQEHEAGEAEHPICS